jgi:capsular exopolysaccharide synthesis family protein
MPPQDAGRPEPTSNPSNRPAPRPVAGRVAPPAARAAAVANPAPPALSGGPDFGALLKALRRRWMAAAVLSLLLGAAAAGAAWYFMAPKYTAFGQLWVRANPETIVGWNSTQTGVAAQSTYIRSQASALTSRRVILHALQQDEVKRLGLESRYPDPLDWIETELKTDFKDPGEYVTVTLNANDPTEATTVLKNIINAYMDEVVYGEQTSKQARLAELDKVFAETSNTLNRKRTNFEEDARKAGATLGSNDHEVLTHQQQELLENLHDAKLNRNAIGLELAKLQGQRKALDIRDTTVKAVEITDAQVEERLEVDPIAKPQLDRLTALKDLVKSIQSKTDDARNPLLVDAQSRITEVQAAVDKRRDALKEELKSRLGASNSQDTQLLKAQLDDGIATLTASQGKVEESIKDMEARADKIGVWNNDLEAQRSEILRLEKLQDDIGTEKGKLSVELKAPPRVSVWQNADLQKRDLKKQILATVAAPIGVILLVCFGVAWVDVRQRRVRSAGDVASGLGIRVVGAVPGAARLERQLTAEPETQPALESFDAIRTQLLRDAGDESARVLLVTSAGAGEGKTTLAGHLASSLARAGRKTLLIDGDLRRPSVHQLLELPMQPGFSEVMLGEVEVSDAVQATTQDGLSVLPAGQWDREVIQALARDGLEGVFERLREEFDFIVIDSHPVLAAADSLLIGQQTDAVILSVLRDVSQMPRVYAASQKLAALGVRVLGAVVNGADPDEVFTAASAPARQKSPG